MPKRKTRKQGIKKAGYEKACLTGKVDYAEGRRVRDVQFWRKDGSKRTREKVYRQGGAKTRHGRLGGKSRA